MITISKYEDTSEKNEEANLTRPRKYNIFFTSYTYSHTLLVFVSICRLGIHPQYFERPRNTSVFT